MRQLFEIDTRDYNPDGVGFYRPSARCITIRDNLVAMVHSGKYDYYKFPGGGIEAGETNEQALIRETLEETGLTVIPTSIREYGYVRRAQRDDFGKADFFVQLNYYYLCDVEAQSHPQHLDDYEADEHFTLTFVTADQAIQANEHRDHGPKDPLMIQREAQVLKLLKAEGFLH